MKNTFKKLILLIVPFMVIGCTQAGTVSSSSRRPTNSRSSSQRTSSNRPSSSKSSSSSLPHDHVYSDTLSYNSQNHYKVCTICGQTKDVEAHDMVDWTATSESTLPAAAPYKFANARIKGCKKCGYHQLDGNVLPEVRFTFDPTDPDADFATKAKKDDITRPEVEGTVTITNCDSKYQMTDAPAAMKVRGNQTAGWSKKGFRLKFDPKRNCFGLDDGAKFKKWVLLADAKDTTLIRTALGLELSKRVCQDDPQVWYAEYTPVNVFLNDEYWGYYYLADQKEVKSGRINLPEVSASDTSTDIGYCFELDYYATDERKKGADADATFTVNYSPRMVTGNVQGALPPGGITTYTILSDITDGPVDAATTDQNSVQTAFIKNKVEQLYTILYEAAVNKTAKEINENNQIVNSSKSIKEVITQYFDLRAWADGTIINAYCCPPDLGYSSFYMSYDNSPSGDKKLRFDCPWDFDSNFGNRNGFITNADQLYVDKTHNMWLQLLYKLDFFVNEYVKVKWNKLRDEMAFEGLIEMMKNYYNDYDCEIRRNHTKWPQNDAAHQPPNNFDEIREPFKDPARYKDAETETISWCTKRVNYLESVWGNGRANLVN